VHANPDGTGEPWHRPDEDDKPGRDDDDDGGVVVIPGRPGGGLPVDPTRPFGDKGVWIGRVTDIVYDECGCLLGFILVSCAGKKKAFRLDGDDYAKVLHRACRDRSRIAVYVKRKRIRRITVVCC